MTRNGIHIAKAARMKLLFLTIVLSALALADSTAKKPLAQDVIFEIHTGVLRLSSTDPTLRAKGAAALSTRPYLEVQSALNLALKNETDATVKVAIQAALTQIAGQAIIKEESLRFPEEWVDNAIKSKSEMALKRMLEFPEWIPVALLAEQLPNFVYQVLDLPEIRNSEIGHAWRKAILESNVPGSEKAKAAARGEPPTCAKIVVELPAGTTQLPPGARVVEIAPPDDDAVELDKP